VVEAGFWCLFGGIGAEFGGGAVGEVGFGDCGAGVGEVAVFVGVDEAVDGEE